MSVDYLTQIFIKNNKDFLMNLQAHQLIIWPKGLFRTYGK